MFFPTGNYSVTGLRKAFDIADLNAVNLMGEGPQASRLTKSGTSTDAIIRFETAAGSPQQVTELPSEISNLGLDGSYTSVSHNGIDLYWCAYVLIRNVEIKDCSAGISFSSSLISRVVNSHVHNCRVGIETSLDTGVSGAPYPNLVEVTGTRLIANEEWGIKYSAGDKLIVSGCNFEENGISNTGSYGGILIGSTQQFTTRAIHTVDACWFEKNEGRCVRMMRGHLRISGCFFVDNNDTAGDSYNLVVDTGNTSGSVSITNCNAVRSGGTTPLQRVLVESGNAFERSNCHGWDAWSITSTSQRAWP